MEPAMALCTGVAAVTLTFGVLGSLHAFAGRLATVRLPIPVRSLAVLLTMASLTAVLARPRPAAATIAPPIVRLVDETASPTDGTETPADEADAPTSAPPYDRSAGRASVTTERARSGTAAHVVELGDSLWRIAGDTLTARNGAEPSSAEIARFWPAIYAANRGLIGDNPNLIFPGQRLQIPEG
jgi:nucleoid-associated protein YgaU